MKPHSTSPLGPSGSITTKNRSTLPVNYVALIPPVNQTLTFSASAMSDPPLFLPFILCSNPKTAHKPRIFASALQSQKFQCGSHPAEVLVQVTVIHDAANLASKIGKISLPVKTVGAYEAEMRGHVKLNISRSCFGSSTLILQSSFHIQLVGMASHVSIQGRLSHLCHYLVVVRSGR